MIYKGAYYNLNIYGTTNNNQIVVETEDQATFLSCTLNVTFNNFNWTHTFEIPFFNNTAQFYFENYIHSIITQKFKTPTVNYNEINIHSFDVARIDMTLIEMQNSTILEQQNYSFFMTLGNFDTLDITALAPSYTSVINTPQTQYITDKGVICFSFFASQLPLAVILNTPELQKEIPVVNTSTTHFIHTITIPVKTVYNYTSNNINLSLKFNDDVVLNINDFFILKQSIDHNNIAYQNSNGTLSILEFLGELKTENNYKTDVFDFIDNNTFSMNTNKIEIQEIYKINTGYITDPIKYDMLKSVLNSFNIFIMNKVLLKIILNNSQKLMPYKSNYYLNNESLTFKLAQNDNIHYRIF